jgi:cell division septation protein DedD
MDVSFYISELLEQHGEVSVPGLGYLVLARVSGHYNEAEGKFYPPHHLVQFDPQQIDDDDTLTQYIADVKNISLASSKYFTEKYINIIKEESLIKEVALANLGWFYIDHGKLTFRAADITDNDPAFFGLAPVEINRLGQNPVSGQYVPENNISSKLPIADGQQVADESPITSQQEEFDEEEEFKRSKTWLVFLILVIVLVVAAFGIYRYSPNTVTKAEAWVQNILHPDKTITSIVKLKKDSIQAVVPAIGDTTGKRDTANIDVVKTDTIKKIIPANTKDKQVIPTAIVSPPTDVKKNTAGTTATQTAATDIPAGAHWAVIALVCQTRTKADAIVNQYKQNGLNAFIASARGSVIKIAAGAYATNDEADAARAKMVESKKIPKDAYLQEIKPNR